jgi:hypothetical protein
MAGRRELLDVGAVGRADGGERFAVREFGLTGFAEYECNSGRVA